jgi:hypothetical protein
MGSTGTQHAGMCERRADRSTPTCLLPLQMFERLLVFCLQFLTPVTVISCVVRE